MFGVHSAMPLRTAGPAVPAGRVPARRRPQVPGGEPRGHGDPPAVHAAGPADLDRRGVPRRDGVACAVRRRRADRPADQGRDPRRGRADGVGRRGVDEAGREDRVGPAEARRAGRRAARRGGGVPGAAADLAAVGRGRQDGRGAARLRGRDDRRPRGAPIRTCSCGGSASTAAPSSTVPSAATPIPWRRATRRSRSATSTRSTSTRPAARRSSGRCWAWPTASRGGCGRPA